MALLSQKDFDLTLDFLQTLEQFFDNRSPLRTPEEDWLDWDDDDETKKELLNIRCGVAFEEGSCESDVDNRLVLYEFIKRKYLEVDCHWGRTLWCGKIAVDNVADPNKSYLDTNVTVRPINVRK